MSIEIDEATENQLADAKLVHDVLGMDLSHFEEYRRNVAASFLNFGDDFIKRLGHLLIEADRTNDIKSMVKVLHVWKKESIEYEMRYRIFQAKEKAING